MHTSTSHPTHTIFIKTAKGRDEVALRGHGLNPRQRRVLIVMDGTKSLSRIMEVIPWHELNEIVSLLTQQSFIAATESHAGERQMPTGELAATGEDKTTEMATAQAEPVLTTQQDAPVAPPKPEMTLIQDAEKIREIKDFMTTTATTYLGLMAADLIHRIERAKEAAALMSVVGQWHMALRGSKHGNQFAGPYLEQVSAALSGKTS